MNEFLCSFHVSYKAKCSSQIIHFRKAQNMKTMVSKCWGRLQWLTSTAEFQPELPGLSLSKETYGKWVQIKLFKVIQPPPPLKTFTITISNCQQHPKNHKVLSPSHGQEPLKEAVWMSALLILSTYISKHESLGKAHHSLGMCLSGCLLNYF